MALSYSVRFAKQGVSGRVVMEKEGEIVLAKTGVRLKGKGANDAGEMINFTDIKECSSENNQMLLTNFSKEKYILTRFGTGFQAFLEDFFHYKNDFMIENMLMKSGMLLSEQDCHCELFSPSGKHVVKGKSVIQIYEGSIVIIPKLHDVFTVSYDFLKRHEADRDRYLFTLELESGVKIQISKLGSSLDDVDESIQGALEKMFQIVLNRLLNLIPGTAIPILLKIANQMRNGKALSLAALKKIDAALPNQFLDNLYKNNQLLTQKIQYLRSLDSTEQFYVAASVTDSQADHEGVVFWWACFLPTHNSIVIGLDGANSFQKQIFFKLSSEKINIEDLLPAKALEINQAVMACKQDFSIFTKPLAELKKHRLFVTITKNIHLRNFKKTVIGYSESNDLEKFKSDAQKYLNMAKISYIPQPKFRRNIKSTVKN